MLDVSELLEPGGGRTEPKGGGRGPGDGGDPTGGPGPRRDRGASVRPAPAGRGGPVVPPQSGRSPLLAAGPALPPSLRRAAPALVGFLAIRLAGTLLVVLGCLLFGDSPYERLLRPWDAQWYEHIATYGYGFARNGRQPGLHYRDIAFFPLYPGLVRTLRLVVPFSVPVLALVVSWGSALLAAWGIHAVVERLRDHRTATLLVLLWALLPHAVVLSVPYSESLLVACAAWGLWALLDGRWVWAGTCAALAGLARPNGAALAAAVILAGLWLAWTTRAVPAPRVLAGMALSPLGWFGYVLYVGWERGDVFGGYFAVQRDWGSTFDFGLAMLRYTDHIEIGVNRPERIVAVLLVSGALLLYAALLTEERRPLPGALLVYTGVLVLIAVGGSAYLTCKPRFLLPAFPLLIPLADRLAAALTARPGRALVLLASLAGPALLYGAYLVSAAPTAL
ncbi:hypothetical protein GA0115257_104830 [Streptomyces sp. LcepLS]|nr:hypothetical protein [Streptomyces sp. SID4945]SCE94857.1 hypothetical protein GA0115257_104830 [Streptomyces sp. LcepLS]